jgi:hypothetical protein
MLSARVKNVSTVAESRRVICSLDDSCFCSSDSGERELLDSSSAPRTCTPNLLRDPFGIWFAAFNQQGVTP